MSPPVPAQCGGAAWWRPLVEAAHQVGGDDGDDGDDRSHPQHRASWARADTINGMSEPPALTQILDPSAHRGAGIRAGEAAGDDRVGLATYAYIAPTMTDLAGFSTSFVRVVLGIYGAGMVSGMVVSGRAASLGIMRDRLRTGPHRAHARGVRAPRPPEAPGHRHGVRPRFPAVHPRTHPPDAAHGRRPRGPVARRRPQPLDPRHRQRARGVAGQYRPAAGLGYEWPSRVGARSA